MSRTTWAILLVLYALVAVAIPFIGYALPPCLGNAEGHISPECLARWEDAMPLLPQRFVYLLGAPMSALVSFLTLTGMTLIVDAIRRLRGKSGAGSADAD